MKPKPVEERKEPASRSPAGEVRRALLWTYDPQVASARHRLLPVMETLEERGWRIEIDRLPKKRYFRRILERRAALSRASVLVVGKISFGLGEAELLRLFAPPTLFDVDDAIYLRHSKASKPGDRGDRGGGVRRLKFRRTCAAADHVVAGNEILAAATGKKPEALTVLPTSVLVPSDEDLAAWRDAGRDPKVVTWIGRPENLVYLEPLRKVLADLCRRRGVVLRVICSSFPHWPEVEIERVEWSAESEMPALATAGIGIMPLRDDAWSRGKCGFKLLQYMSVALPTVASPVGLNAEIVEPGVTGHLADDPSAWQEALESLLDQPEEAEAMGRRGRRRAVEDYGRHSYVERYVRTIEGVVGS